MPHPLSLPPWGCYRLKQMQGPACMSWYLVDLENANPPGLQTPCSRIPLVSFSLPNKQRVPAALPCPPAGSPNLLSPLPNLYPTRPWSQLHVLLHPVATVLWSLLCLSFPSFCVGLRGREPSPTRAGMRWLRTMTHCQSACSCVVFCAVGCCLSFRQHNDPMSPSFQISTADLLLLYQDQAGGAPVSLEHMPLTSWLCLHRCWPVPATQTQGSLGLNPTPLLMC